MTDPERNEYQEAMVHFCAEQHPAYFLTLSYHTERPVQPHWAEKRLWYFGARLDRQLLGKKWAALPAELRTQYIAIPEGRRVGSGVLDFHYHLLLHCCPRQDRMVARAVENRRLGAAKLATCGGGLWFEMQLPVQVTPAPV